MRITLISILGEQHHIETFKPEVLREWLAEWLPLVVPEDPVAAQATARIGIFPSFDPATGQPDWLTDSRVIGYQHPIETTDPDEALIYIRELRKREEAQLARIKAGKP